MLNVKKWCFNVNKFTSTTTVAAALRSTKMCVIIGDVFLSESARSSLKQELIMI
jgi:hypothetical protein